MSGTVADLITTLGQAITAFNLSGNWQQYQAANETVFRNHAQQSASTTLHGNDARAYLQRQTDDHPIFTLRDLTIHGNGIDGEMREATLSGTSHWHDDNGDEELRFLFKAAYVEGRWLFTEVSADTIGPLRPKK